MTERIEYGTKAAADAARERHTEYLCSEDDRRLTTVAYTSDTPQGVLSSEMLEAQDWRGERSDGPGQVPLSDGEKDRIDFSASWANVPHAKSVKGIAQAEGVEDWVAYYDGTLTVDEHREVMADAATESGKRTDDTESADEKAGRAARSAQSNQCDHAKGHCENGDPEACEFLTESCQYTFEEVVNDVLADRAPDPRPDPTHPDDRDPLTGKQKGALKRSWEGYKGAIEGLEAAISALRENWKQAQQAARAINAVRAAAGQESMHFERLEEEQAHLLDLTREMAADCHECHTDHTGHDHERSDALELDDQQTLDGDRADDQARLAGGEQGERGQGEVVETTEENPGGLMADEREADQGADETEQQTPDAFRVAEGGQSTL